MRIRKIATLAVAIAMPLSAIGAIAAAEVSSAAAPPDSGPISCSGPATATLSVPFVPGGTLTKKSLTTLPGATYACSGGSALPGKPVSVTASAAKIQNKYPKPGQIVNNCSTFLSSPPTITAFTLKVKWADKTKSVISMVGGSGVTSPPGFILTGTVTSGSFAGESVTITAAVDGPTLGSLVACLGGSPTPVGTLGLNTTIAIS